MSKLAIFHQLSTLRISGIVRYCKDIKEVYYMLDDNHIREVTEIGTIHIKHREANSK